MGPCQAIETLLIKVRIHRGIARFIPCDVLYHICEATEDEGDRNVVNRKHRKNLDILSIMGVCRSWNDQIRGLNGLFTDIAFDTSNHITISTAAKFLETVESRSSNLRVYARCVAWADGQTQTAFLSRLRLQSWRFVHFEVDHVSTPFIAYFNLPAPRLLRLIHTSALPERLFASSFTSLRVIDASVKKHFPWPTATLSNLVTLRLENSHCARRFCATSLFDLIGGAHNLEELRLTDFLRFSGDLKTKLFVCAKLKSVHFIQCNLKFILQHLRCPNANSLHVESYGVDLAGEQDLPPSGDVDFFLPLQACSIPIIEQQLSTKISVHMQDLFTNNVYLKLGLECGASRAVDFRVAFRKEGQWEAYFKSSINGILQRIRLGARVDLSIFHHLPLSPIELPSSCPCVTMSSLADSPLLRLPQVALLRTDHSLFQDMVVRLADPEHMILPNLKCYSFDVEMLPTSADLAAPETVTCLRSRFKNGAPLAMQYWTLDGKARSDVLLPMSADARRSLDTDMLTTVTVLIEGSLPALAPFLRGMNDGFVGEGGYVSGDLYVEHSMFEL